MNEYQDLSTYSVPDHFRGRSKFFVQLWRCVAVVFFARSPQFSNRFRVLLLRMFGAEIGRHVVIRPSVRIPYPWRLKVGDYAQIGDYVELYSLGLIVIGSHSVVSQYTYVCAGDHDYGRSDFQIRARPIVIGNQVWIGTGSFIGPGAEIGDGAVVGARSGVFGVLPSGMICVGTPCVPIRSRK